MQINKISQQQCGQLLNRASVGRLACALDNQPYVVPVSFAYEPDYIYIFATLGKKIEWMRQNPKVCLEVDEIENHMNWISVIVTGTYLELREPEFAAQREHAKELLGQNAQWWLTPLAGRRKQSDDLSIKPVFFRINIESVSGLRALPEG